MERGILLRLFIRYDFITYKLYSSCGYIIIILEEVIIISYNRTKKLHIGYIYVITNTINKKQYVGQTIRTIEQRWGDHLRKQKYNKDNQYLYTAMKKYGTKNFLIQEVETVECKSKNDLLQLLNEKEIHYIRAFNTRKPNGYNMTDGGVLMPNTFPSKPVCNYDLERNLVHEFESMSEAARYYNISEADISYCCNREKVGIVGGFIWRVKGDDYDVKTIELNTKVVCQYDLHGNFIEKYNGVIEAERTTGIRNIGQCCNGNYTHAGYYVWRFLGDGFDKYKLPCFKKVIIYDLDLKYVSTFNTTKEASDFSGISAEEIYKLCNSHGTKNGYIWSFECNIESIKTPKRIKYYKEKDKKIYMYDIYGNLIDTFIDINSIPSHYSFRKAIVLNICRGKSICYNEKYIFSFSSDFSNNYLHITKLDCDRNYVKKYNTIGELVDDGYNYKNIINGCKNNKMYYGYCWEIDNNEEKSA